MLCGCSLECVRRHIYNNGCNNHDHCICFTIDQLHNIFHCLLHVPYEISFTRSFDFRKPHSMMFVMRNDAVKDKRKNTISSGNPIFRMKRCVKILEKYAYDCVNIKNVLRFSAALSPAIHSLSQTMCDPVVVWEPQCWRHFHMDILLVTLNVCHKIKTNIIRMFCCSVELARSYFGL